MKRKIAIILLSTIFFFLFLFILVHTPPLRSLVRSRIQSFLEKTTGAEVAIGSLDYNLLKWTFTIEDVSLSKRNAPPFLRIARIKIDLANPLAKDPLTRIQEIRVDQPLILYRASAGSTNLPSKPDKEESGDRASAIPGFLIKKMTLTKGKIRLEFPDEQRIVDIPGLNLELKGEPGGLHELKIHAIPDAQIKYGDQKILFGLQEFNGQLDQRHLRINSCRIGKGGNELAIQGEIRYKDLNAPQMDIGVKAELTAGQGPVVLNLHPSVQIQSGSKLFVSAQLKGPVSKPRIEASGQFKEIRFSRPASTLISASAQLSSTGFSIESLDGKADMIIAMPGIHAKGNIESKGKSIQGNMEIDIPQLDRALAALNSLPLPAQVSMAIKQLQKEGISGRVRMKSTAGGSLDNPVINLETRGRLKVGNNQSILPLVFSAALIHDRGRARIQSLALKRGKGRLHISGGIAPGSSQKQVELKIVAQNISNRGLAPYIIVPVKGKIDCSARLKFPMDASRMNGLVENLNIVTQNQELTSSNPFRFSIAPDGLSVNNLVLTGEGSRAALNGSLPSALDLEASLDCALATAIFPSLSASGTLDIRGRINGPLSKPGIQATLLLNGVSVSLDGLDGPVNNINGQLTASGPPAQLAINDLTCDWKKARVSLSGDLLPGPDIHITVTDLTHRILAAYLPESLLENFNTSAGLEFHIKGDRPQVEHLSGNGTISNLTVKLDDFSFEQASPLHLNLKDRRITVEALNLSGPKSRLEGSGSVELSPPFSYRAHLNGALQAGILSSIWEGPRFSGSGLFRLDWTGSSTGTSLNGQLEVKDYGFAWEEYNLHLDRLNGTIMWENGNLKLPAPITGNLNGGAIKVTAEPDWTFHLDRIRWDYPAGLRGLASGGLTLKFQGGQSFLEGEITFSGAAYREPFDLSSQLFSLFRRDPGGVIQTLPETGPDWLDFNISIRTLSPLRLENNVSRAELSAQLKLTGTPARPVLAGRATFKKGGEFYLGKHTFYIGHGIINFSNPLEIEPELDISARTQVADTGIRLKLEGTFNELNASLNSTPSLPESRIIQLLLTGRHTASSSTSTPLWNEAGNRVLDYLSMTLAGKLEQAVKRKLGLDTVRIDGSLVASRENPGARLTIGSHLTDNLEAVVSQSLKRSQDRTWIVKYAPYPNIEIEAARTDDNAYSAAIRHQLQWGLDHKAPTAVPRLKPRRIKEILIRGTPVFSRSLILSKLGVKESSKYRFYTIQKGIKRLQKLYRKHRYLDATISTRKQEEGEKIALVVEIDAGIPVQYDIQGIDLNKGLKKQLDQAWIKAYTPSARTSNLTQVLYGYLYGKGYYTATIKVHNGTVFNVQKGKRFKHLHFRFQGNKNVSPAKLAALLNPPAMKTLCLTRPESVARRLEQWYRLEGFPGTKVKAPRLRISPRKNSAELLTTIQEGPRYRFGQIRFQGNKYTSSDELKSYLTFKTGQLYKPAFLEEAAAVIVAKLTRMGRHYSRVSAEPVPRKKDGLVDIVFHLDERPRYRIEGFEIQGTQRTRAAAIRRRFRFKKGDIVRLKEINETRKRLYDLNIFESVDIRIQPARQPLDKNGETSCTIIVEVREIQPCRLHYGLQWDTDTYTGLTAQFDFGNFDGHAGFLGASLLLNSKERDGRLFFGFPYLLGSKSSTELFLFANRKEETGAMPPVERWGFTVQQQWRPSRAVVASLGYTYETYRGDQELKLSHCTAAITFDTRDSLLDASRGVFLSQSLQYSSKWLGSDLDYFRYMGTFNFYQPLVPRLTAATSLHLGLGEALGNRLLPGGERFYAGGGTTLRGFKYNKIGPLDPVTGEALGGSAMILLRQELRWMVFPNIGAVVFADLGNIYPDIPSIRPFKLRTAAGIGLRYRFSGLILRLDWGFNLKPIDGESSSHVYFSIGQAF